MIIALANKLQLRKRINATLLSKRCSLVTGAGEAQQTGLREADTPLIRACTVS